MPESGHVTKTFSIAEDLLIEAIKQSHIEEISFSAWLCNLVKKRLGKVGGNSHDRRKAKRK